MSEPTKNMPDDAMLARWAKGEINVLGVQALAAEILRLRAELSLAKEASQQLLDVKRNAYQERDEAIAEADMLRAELAKASAEVQPCSDGWRYGIASIGWLTFSRTERFADEGGGK